MIELNQVGRSYPTKRGVLHALADVDLRVCAGEFVVVHGPSGSGKTTLLWAIGAMLHPTTGRVQFCGRDLYGLAAAERSRLRATEIGFVFQASHLLPYLSLRDNVKLGPIDAVSLSAVDRLLERLHLTERASHRPGELSAGEQQRTALARAVVKQPKLVLADEPTGNLDPENGAEVLDVLHEFNQGGGTVVLVTHGREAESFAGRFVRLEAGRIVESRAPVVGPTTDSFDTL